MAQQWTASRAVPALQSIQRCSTIPSTTSGKGARIDFCVILPRGLFPLFAHSKTAGFHTGDGPLRSIHEPTTCGVIWAKRVGSCHFSSFAISAGNMLWPTLAAAWSIWGQRSGCCQLMWTASVGELSVAFHLQPRPNCDLFCSLKSWKGHDASAIECWLERWDSCKTSFIDQFGADFYGKSQGKFNKIL